MQPMYFLSQNSKPPSHLWIIVIELEEKDYNI